MSAQLYQYVKYILSGGTGACVNISVLYTLTEYGHWHYLASAIVAFLAAFVVSFTLQKFWTFTDSRVRGVHHQAALYLGVACINLLINTALLYVLVEFFHLWYILAEVMVAGMLAIATFFIYRNIIFIERSVEHNKYVHAVRMFFNERELFILPAIALAIFLTGYQLTESPPTWLDEGIITQIALNISEGHFKAALMTAPGELVSAGYVTTAYPVTYSIAGTFHFFGAGLLQARIVMALFLLLLVYVTYRYTRSTMEITAAVYAFWLLVTFAPLYGNGKNVLGEIPGLLFLLIFLYWCWRIEYRKTSWHGFALTGLFLGLAVATKPIFILVLLPAAIVLLFSRHLLTIPKIIAGGIGFFIPAVLWFLLQFKTETVGEMLAIYANPHSSDIAASIGTQLLSFVTTPQPMYAALLLGVWLLAVVVRLWKKEPISRAEWIAIGFTVLVYLAYLRGAAYYRYFFLGEVLALLYFAQSLQCVWWQKFPRVVYHGLLVMLIVFQLYQCFFNSWVAEYYGSTRTKELLVLQTFPPEKSVFIYQAPEMAVFLPQKEYYQYLRITDTIEIGREQLLLVEQGVPDIVVGPDDGSLVPMLSKYTKGMTLDRYAVWYKY